MSQDNSEKVTKNIDKESKEIREKTEYIKNKSWFRYEEGENVLWYGHPSMIILVPELIMGILVFALGMVLSFKIGFAGSSLLEMNVVNNSLTYLGFGLMILSVAGVLYDYFKIKATYYVVTDEKVWFKAGIIKRDSRPVHYSKMQHARSFQDLLDRIVNIGSVKIATAGTAGEEKNFKHVHNPDYVNKLISEKMHDETEGKNN